MPNISTVHVVAHEYALQQNSLTIFLQTDG